MEVLDLEELAAAGVHEFAFVGACLRIRGATGSPIRAHRVPSQDDGSWRNGYTRR